MGEVVNVLVAFAVIVFLFRWVTSDTNSSDRAAQDVLGFRPKTVTQDMMDTISGMFPDIPPDNIRYDLLRTGSVAQTSNKILERGFLDAPPPAYYTLFPRDGAGAPARPANANAPNANANARAGAASRTPKESLITRYNLQDRVATSPPVTAELAPEANEHTGGNGGKAVWEDSAEKREASLRERKAQMVLDARRRLLAQRQQQQTTGPADL